ncbi:MAG: class IV adenylate cyclase [Pirellulales bacterium]|nr:class IV adenylate cyclase [Pirellulales bacterium]
MRNIELKARVDDLDLARQTAEAIADKRLGARRQVDTYFRCHQGRLKLRQMDRSAAQLIWYARPDQPDAKASDYLVVPVANPETLKTALAAALGVLVIVEKHREAFLWKNVRIHLDRVEGLGDFLEFEAVLGPTDDDAVGRQRLAELTEQFRIDKEHLVPASYSDLLG